MLASVKTAAVLFIGVLLRVEQTSNFDVAFNDLFIYIWHIN